MIEIGAELKFAAEKPRLDEAEFVILAPSTELGAQAQLLTAALEPGRMEQIEVALGHLYEPKDPVNGTELDSDRKIASVHFVDRNDEILAIRTYFRRLGLR